jgi:hypothetical protein
MDRAWSGRTHCLVVVPRDQPDLLDHLSQELFADPEIELLIDRRRGERRQARAGQAPDDRRRADRRRATDERVAVRLDGVVIAFRAHPLEAAPLPSPPAAIVPHPDVPVLAEARARIADWVRDSQGVVEAVPTVMARYRALLKVARALEGRRARLAAELGTLRREHQRLWADRATLLGLLDRAIRGPENGRDPADAEPTPPVPTEAWRETPAEVASLIAAVRDRSQRMLGGIREARQALGLPAAPRTALCPRCASVVSDPGVDTRWACVVCAWVGSLPAERALPPEGAPPSPVSA